MSPTCASSATAISTPWIAFEFEGGLYLRLFAVNTTELESWNLFSPEHKVLVIGPGVHWPYIRSDVVSEES